MNLSYLAGLIDGEGCLGLYRTGPYNTIRPAIQIAGTNKAFMYKIHRFLNKLKIKHRIYNQKFKNFPKWKNPIRIIIEPFEAVIKILNLVEKDLILKKKQAKILIKFCSRKKYSDYTAKEINFLKKIKKLNKKGR